MAKKSDPKPGDRVTCLHPEPAYYSGYGGRPEMIFRPGMVGTVKSVAAKVRIVSGLGKDGRDTFLVVDYEAPDTGKVERVGLNYANAMKVE